MKPVLFCDFDGVLNQFPYVYHRVLDEADREEFTSAGLEFIALGASEWALQKQSCDEDKFFAPDSRFVAKADNGEFLISYSSEMIERLRKLVVSGEVEFVWLTTWREHTNMLNLQFGFPEDKVSWLPWFNKRSDYSHAGKGKAIEAWFEDHPEFVDRRWVWLDDVATARFSNWNELEGFVEPGLVLENVNGDCLILDTDEQWGLSKAELAALEGFVR